MAHSAELEAAISRLRSGGLVAFPTETVYGLGADAANPEAIARVFAAKRRPAENPLIVHASDVEMARRAVRAWPEAAQRLAERFWPGPLTLVLPKAAWVPPAVTAGGDAVAVRVPDHPVAIVLIEAFERPIVGPSANPAGYISPTSAEHVRAHFDEREVLVLDGGPCKAGIESTVLDLTTDPPRVLRRGVVDPEELAAVLGVAPADPPWGSEEHPTPASPGVIGPHYQPRTPVRLLTNLDTLGREIAGAGGKVVLLSPPGRPVRIQPPHVALAMPGLASGYARRLYAALREADGEEAVVIFVVVPALSDSPIWEAIRDRLRRSAAS